MEKIYKILAINPGSTSTKVAYFHNYNKVFSANIEHASDVLKTFSSVKDQIPFRRAQILQALTNAGIDLTGTDAFVGRGGGTGAVSGGVYAVNDLMLQNTLTSAIPHPACLGATLAQMFAEVYGGNTYIINSPDVDEFQELARISGLKGLYRCSHIHALNQKEIALRHAEACGKPYEALHLIVCHIGGGISITAHAKGQMIDSNDNARGDGPLAPSRCGSVAACDMIDLCFSGQYTEKQLRDKFTKTGGLVDHLGTSDARQILTRIQQGDDYAKLIYDAMVYQIAKAIGQMAVVLKGKIDGILFTGGLSHDQYLVETLKEYVSFLGPISVYPGEFEMEALAFGALRVMSGQEKCRKYTGDPVWVPPHFCEP